MSIIALANFKADCQNIINTFLAKNSSKFKDFASVWRDMQFSFVFLGQRPLGLMKQFTEDALTIAKDYWLKPDNLGESIGGLYLLYGLYFKNRLPGLIQITLTLDDSKKVSDFANKITESTYEEAAPILQKLFDNEAFHFSASVHSYGLERQHRPKSIPNIYAEVEKFDRACSKLIEFMPVYDHYVESKKEISHLVCDLSVSNRFSSLLPDEVRRRAGLSTDDPSTSESKLSQPKQSSSKNKLRKNSVDNHNLSDLSTDAPSTSRRVFTQRASKSSRNKRELSGLSTNAPSTSRDVFSKRISTSSGNEGKKNSLDTSVLPGLPTDAPSTSKSLVSHPKPTPCQNKGKKSSLDTAVLTGLSITAPSTSKSVLLPPETTTPENKRKKNPIDKDTDALPDLTDACSSYIITNIKSGIHAIGDDVIGLKGKKETTDLQNQIPRQRHDSENSDDVKVNQILTEVSYWLKPLISPLRISPEEQTTLPTLEQSFTSGSSNDAPNTSQSVLQRPETSFPEKNRKKNSINKDPNVLPNLTGDIDSYIITNIKSGINSVGDDVIGLKGKKETTDLQNQIPRQRHDSENSDDVKVNQILTEVSYWLKPLISPLTISPEEQTTLPTLEQSFTSGSSNDAPNTSQSFLLRPETSFPENKRKKNVIDKNTDVLPDIAGDSKHDPVDSDYVEEDQKLNDEVSHLLKPVLSPLSTESLEQHSTPLILEQPFISGLSSDIPSTSQSVLLQPEISFSENKKNKNSIDKDHDVLPDISGDSNSYNITNNKSGIHSVGDDDVIGLKENKDITDSQNQSARNRHETINSEDVQIRLILAEVSYMLKLVLSPLSPRSFQEPSTLLTLDQPFTSGLSSDAPSTSQSVLPPPETGFPENKMKKNVIDNDHDVLPDITVDSDVKDYQIFNDEVSDLPQSMEFSLSSQSDEEPTAPQPFEDPSTPLTFEQPFTSGLSIDAASTSQSVLPRPETSFPENKTKKNVIDKDHDVLPDITVDSDVQDYQILNDEVSGLLQSLELSLSSQLCGELTTPMTFDEPLTLDSLEEPFLSVFSGEVSNLVAGEDDEFSWIFKHDNE